MHVGVGVERRLLVAERLDPAVGVRPAHGDAVELPGQHVRRRGDAADPGRPAHRQPAVDALGTAEPELEHRVAVRGIDDARRLGRDERLEADDREQHRLGQLGLEQRAADPDERLVREHDRPFRDGVDVAREAEGLQAVEEGGLEQRAAVGGPQRRQVGQVLRRVAQRVEDLDGVGQPGGDRVAALERASAEGQVEDRLTVGDPGLDVAGGHRQLVEVGERRQGRAIDVADVRHGHLPTAAPTGSW